MKERLLVSLSQLYWENDRLMKKAVVTGCAGFIGGHLTQKLIDDGWYVVGIDNMYSGLQSTMDMHIKKGSFRPVYLDVSDANHISRIESSFKELSPDIVFHLAAISGVTDSVNNPVFSNNSNITGTVNMLDLSRKYSVKRFVFSSSSSVYGGSNKLPTNESSELSPRSPYALQKKVGEEYCSIFSELYGLETVSLRYFNVFGPRQRADSAYAAAISSFCNNLKERVRPTIYGTGEQSRDFCYVDNIVYANILAANLELKLYGDCFNIGCGGRVSINSVCEALGTMRPIYKDARLGDVMHSQADISKARSILGYEPVISYKEGLLKTSSWFINE